MANRLLIILFILVSTFAYVAYQGLVLDNKLANELVLEKNSVLKVLPQVSYPEFENDVVVSLNNLNKDNFLVVHFWATWCGPCEREFPQLLKLTELNKSNSDIKFAFVSVNDNKNDIKKFLTKFVKDESNFLVLQDNLYFSQKLFGSYKLPETFVFSKNGALIKRFSGPQDWTSSYFLEFFKSLKD